MVEIDVLREWIGDVAKELALEELVFANYDIVHQLLQTSRLPLHTSWHEGMLGNHNERKDRTYVALMPPKTLEPRGLKRFSRRFQK